MCAMKLLTKTEIEWYKWLFQPGNLFVVPIYKHLLNIVDENKTYEIIQIRDFVVRQQQYSIQDLLVFDEILMAAISASEPILRKCFENNVKRSFKNDGFGAFLMIKCCANLRKAAGQKPVDIVLRGSSMEKYVADQSLD